MPERNNTVFPTPLIFAIKNNILFPAPDFTCAWEPKNQSPAFFLKEADFPQISMIDWNLSKLFHQFRQGEQKKPYEI